MLAAFILVLVRSDDTDYRERAKVLQRALPAAQPLKSNLTRMLAEVWRM